MQLSLLCCPLRDASAGLIGEAQQARAQAGALTWYMRAASDSMETRESWTSFWCVSSSPSFFSSASCPLFTWPGQCARRIIEDATGAAQTCHSKQCRLL